MASLRLQDRLSSLLFLNSAPLSLHKLGDNRFPSFSPLLSPVQARTPIKPCPPLTHLNANTYKSTHKC